MYNARLMVICDDKLWTPPGPEGSNGSGDLGCRGVAGAGYHLKFLL